jgi:acetyl esterase
MPLDPEVAEFLAACAREPAPSPRDAGLAAARSQMVEASVGLGPFPEMAETRDLTIPGPHGAIPLRIYRPQKAHGGILMYFHGGGWVLGSIETHDGYCRSLAAGSGATIVSVDYRLAPEHKFPAAFDDCLAATRWAAAQAASLECDARRLGVAGDSAGGNLAAAVALAARDDGGPALAFQYLIYPVTDAACDTPSYAENAEGYYLSRDSMLWFWEQYLRNPRDGAQAYASPVRATDLKGLPPALVTTAEYDPLRDEGEAYARRLSESGVKARLIRYPGMIHGFARRGRFFRVARVALDEAAQALRESLGPPA